jgi:hypothetical protein
VFEAIQVKSERHIKIKKSQKRPFYDSKLL